MARWDDGYVTDVVYTSNFYREITPSWLSMTLPSSIATSSLSGRCGSGAIQRMWWVHGLGGKLQRSREGMS